LTTGPQTNQNYNVVSIGATGAGGGTTIVPTSTIINSFHGNGTPGESTPIDGAPRVVGAASLSNTEVIVSFSEPMAANALHPEYYFIVQQNVNPESGYLQITGATWHDAAHTVVKLTTLPQNELTYQVTVLVATDVAGNALAPRLVGQGGVVNDPTSSQFPGTPGHADTAGNLPDADGDGLPDNVKCGWTVTVSCRRNHDRPSPPTHSRLGGDG
jgi:hypothetical protein